MNVTILIRAIQRVATKVRKHDEALTVSGMNVLMAVMEKDEIPMAELVDITGMTLAGVSRTVAVLSDHGRREKAGAGLLVLREDPQERRRKLVSLSPEGKALSAQVKKILSGACERAAKE